MSRRIVLDNSSSQQDQNSSSNTASSWSRNDDTQIDGRAAGWNHLRRRGNDAINEPVSSENRFSIGRSDREERGTKARYTPLSLRPGFGTRRPETQGSSYDTKPATSMLNAEEDISKRASTGLESNATSSQTSDRTALWRPKTFGLPSKYTPDESVDRPRARFGNTFGDARNSLSSISGAETMRETPERKEEREKEREREREQEREREKEVERERERDREERQRKRAERYAAEEASRSRQAADQPRGRDKEKARRREQFVEEWDDDAEAAAAAKAELKKQRKRDKAAKKAAAPTPIFLPEYISVANLATALRVRIEDFIYKMEELGFEETGYDHVLNGEDAGLIAMEYNFEPIIDRGESEDLKARAAPEDSSSLPQRPPVVTIMGHVDHGKTTLLDYLRKSSVAATEHGGITQHIGAFSVPMPSGKTVTFLDTPGHAAFLSMRQRGANVTDIVILVVAADDSVKPQTIEAINHAKAAKVPMIVAINKVDKEEANIERVKQDLARHGVEIEDFGGDTQVVCVSGKTGQGMDELEETVVTLSEILDMRAETDGQAEGWVLEASVKSMGKVATVLVRRGTMRPGDFIVAGNTWARIRCLRNEAGIEINEAGPGTPVQVDGWREQPLAGDEVLQAPTESKAKSVIDYRLEKDERDKLAQDMEAINDARKLEQEKRERDKIEAQLDDMDLEAATPPEKEESGPKQVYFIIKGDVSGSVEAVIDSITGIGNGEVQPHILRSGVGQIAEFDVEHCAAAKGFLINFNTPIDPNIARLAEASKVRILDHNIIYRLVDDVKATLSESLPPLVSQKVLGEAEVAQVFEITVKGRQVKAVAGCKVRNGVVSKNGKVRVMRDGEKVFDGKFCSLIHHVFLGCNLVY
jgi:translation initiation factor IF-2